MKGPYKVCVFESSEWGQNHVIRFDRLTQAEHFLNSRGFMIVGLEWPITIGDELMYTAGRAMECDVYFPFYKEGKLEGGIFFDSQGG